MALKKVFKPAKFAALFDSYEPGYDNLDEIGVKIEVTAAAFSVVGPNGENIVGNIGLNQGAVGMAQAGDLPDIAKAPVKAAIKAAFSHALKGTNWKHEVTVDDIVDEDETPFKENLMSGMLDEEHDDIAAEAEMEASAFKDIDLGVSVKYDGSAEQAKDAEIMKHHDEKVIASHMAKMSGDGLGKSKVELKDADTMYQPVKATSNTSTYHVIGMTISGLKFAARRNEQSLSIRVEGKVAEHKNHLIAAGFNESYISKGYTSVHFHGIDDLMAARALGAVLLGTEQTFTTPMPDLDVIAGKGV